MSNNPIYQLDLAALRGYRAELADKFQTSDVQVVVEPRWNNTLETLVSVIVGVETGKDGHAAFALIPCDWLTPNPAPTFRFLTTVNGHVTVDITVQGIPVEYADYAPILLREGFEWVGVNLGSQRVSIERVIPPVGEGVSE